MWMPQRRRKFSAEFKTEAVRMVIEQSRPIAQVAREINVVEGTLGKWVTDYRDKHADEEPPLSLGERAQLRELKKENAELRMRTEFLGRAAACWPSSLLRSGISVNCKFEFIDGEKANYPIVLDYTTPAETYQARTWTRSSQHRNHA
jgi:transposase-like protein